MITRAQALALAAAAAVVIIVVAAGAVFAKVFEDERADLHPSSIAVEEFYATLDASLAATDGVTLLRAELQNRGRFNVNGTRELWIDAGELLVREGTSLRAGGEDVEQTSIITATERYWVSREPNVSSSRHLQCFGASIAAGAVLGCPGPPTESELRVEQGRYRGRNVIALIEEGTTNADGAIDFVSRLYLDADTLMPLERRYEGTYRSDPPMTDISVTEYHEPEVMDRSELAPDFFSPSSIGYIAPDALAGLNGVTDLQAYWLGTELALPTGETIVLRSSAAAPGRGSPYRLMLSYSTTTAPHEPPMLSVMVFHRDMWERSPAIPGQARTFGDVVVFVNEGALPGAASLLGSPGNLEFVLDSLRPYKR